MEYNKIKKQIKKGEYYSHFLEKHKFIILPKEVCDEIIQIITPENWDNMEKYEKEAFYDSRDLLLSLIGDVVINKNYKVFDVDKPKHHKRE
jgi:hypothetical protein